MKQRLRIGLLFLGQRRRAQLVEYWNFNEQIEVISKWIRSKENGSANEIAVIAREEKTLGRQAIIR